MFYGGKLLSHLTFTNESLDEFILLLNINKNSFVVIDKDAKKETDRINTTKARIQSEIGENNCWITSGREIENYITINSLSKWLAEKKIIEYENLSFTKFDKMEDTLSCITPAYNRNKNGYAKEIVNYITESDLGIMDLKTRLNSLVNAIKKWNS